MNVPNDSPLRGKGSGVSFSTHSEGVCMIDDRPGSVEGDNGDNEDATSIDSSNHLGSAAADG